MESRPGVLIVDDSKVVRAAIAKVIRGTFETHEVGDGEAAWATIERYISRHTDTLFSHSICPDCIASEVEPDLGPLPRE